MPGEDPSLVPSAGSDVSTPTPQPNSDAALFAERALFQCMGFSPQQANQMAESCNGLYNEYKQYLPGISLSGLANSDESDPFMADATGETNSLPSDEYNEAGVNLSSVDGGTSENGSESTDIFAEKDDISNSADETETSSSQDRKLSEDKVSTADRDPQLPEGKISTSVRDPRLPEDKISTATQDPQLPEDKIPTTARDLQLPEDKISTSTQDPQLPKDKISTSTQDPQLPKDKIATVASDSQPVAPSTTNTPDTPVKKDGTLSSPAQDTKLPETKLASAPPDEQRRAPSATATPGAQVNKDSSIQATQDTKLPETKLASAPPDEQRRAHSATATPGAQVNKDSSTPAIQDTNLPETKLASAPPDEQRRAPSATATPGAQVNKDSSIQATQDTKLPETKLASAPPDEQRRAHSATATPGAQVNKDSSTPAIQDTNLPETKLASAPPNEQRRAHSAAAIPDAQVNKDSSTPAIQDTNLPETKLASAPPNEQRRAHSAAAIPDAQVNKDSSTPAIQDTNLPETKLASAPPNEQRRAHSATATPGAQVNKDSSTPAIQDTKLPETKLASIPPDQKPLADFRSNNPVAQVNRDTAPASATRDIQSPETKVAAEQTQISQHPAPEQYAQTNKPGVSGSQSGDVHLVETDKRQSTPAPEKIASTGNPAVAPSEVAQLNRQASVPATDAAPLSRHAVGAVTEGTPSGAQLLAEETATTKTARGVAFGTPGADVTTPLTVAQLADASNPNIAANNLLSANQMIDAMQKNTSLSRDLSRENNLGLVAGSSPLSPNAIGYPPGMQIVDATGKSIADNIGLLSVKESGAIYNPSTTNLAAANSATANLGINGQSIKEGQMVSNATTSQGIAQALQGLLQQGQAASISKLDETGKAIVKGSGASALTEGLVPGQSGKRGSTGPTEGTGSAGIGMPLVVTTKGGSIIDGSTEITLPVPQTGNVTNTGIIITATAGATTTGQTGTAGTTTPGTTTGTTTTGTTGTGTTGTTTNPVPGTHDPNATDIKSLVTALPTVHIIDTKKGDQADDDATGRPEIDYDSVENNDLDDDDDYIDRPVIETRRSQNSAVVNAPKKSANIGLSIIENITVLINDLKNQKVDDLTARRMWADLFTDLFGKQKRQPCAIRADDTLENIARFVLKDPRLAPLLYTINVHTKNIKPLKGNESLEEIGAIKPETNQILLPHRSEILRYKIHVLKEMSALVLYAQGNKIANRDFSAYTCRAGDTLKSIAASHIDVRDENMWADIALLNGLSVRVDKTGNPIAQLKEGQLLQIPKSATYEEYEEEDDDELAESSVKNMSLVSPIANLDINIKDEETVNKALATMEKRIISQSDLGSGKDSVRIKLELREGNKRIKVAEWDVNATSSNLKLYDRFGGCKIISIALPTRAARELAENDLKANAERYCKMFLTGELAA